MDRSSTTLVRRRRVVPVVGHQYHVLMLRVLLHAIWRLVLQVRLLLYRNPRLLCRRREQALHELLLVHGLVLLELCPLLMRCLARAIPRLHFSYRYLRKAGITKTG